MPLYAASRRKPWPMDIEIDGVGFRLRPDDSGEMISRKAQPLEALPSTFEFGSQTPFIERTQAWTDLYFGFGQAVQPAGTPRRVHYCLDVDDSINSMYMLGPKFTSETLAAAGPIRQFIKALYNSATVERLFALTDTGVYVRTADNTWTAVLTTGTAPALAAGSKPRQAIRFKDAAGTDALYIATQHATLASGNNLFQYIGSTNTWALAGAGAGPFENLACAITKIRDELWVAQGNKICKCETGPMTRANYAAQITVGEASSRITWLGQIGDQLVIFKEDGIFTVNALGEAEDLFPSLRLSKDASNGINADSWIEDLWIPWKDGMFKLDPSNTLSPQGPEQLIENRSEVAGRFVGTAGHNTWFNYEILYNPVNGNSYLLKYGSWADIGDNHDPAEFIGVHKGALKKWATKQATCIAVVPGVHSASNDRLYVGFADGTVSWAVLPRNGPDPRQDTECRFSPTDGQVYFPTEHDGFQADNKSYRGVSVFGPSLDGDNYAQVEYRTALASTTWNPVEYLDSDGTTHLTMSYTVSGQRANFIAGDAPVAKAIETRLLLKQSATAAAANTTTPVVDTVAIHHQVRPAFSLDYRFTVFARNRIGKANGATDRYRSEQLRQIIQNAVAAAGPVPVLLPDGEEKEISLIEYEEHLIKRRDRWGLGWDIAVRGIGLELLTPSTMASGLTYDDLTDYLYSQLPVIL